jgi:2-phospho-L-lactate guanylyltransferase
MNQFRVVVPARPLAAALPNMGVAPQLRGELALAFLLDTVTAAQACRSTEEVVVATSDPVVSAAVTALDVRCVPAGPEPRLDAMVEEAMRHLPNHAPTQTAVLVAGLPALLPQELHSVLADVSAATPSYVEDLGGGSTTLFASRRGNIGPCVGPHWVRRHRRARLRRAGRDLPGLRCWVGTLEALAIAHYIGLGQHTRDLLAAHPDLPLIRLAS